MINYIIFKFLEINFSYICSFSWNIIRNLYLLIALKTSIVLSRKTYEHAVGITEEMLYNIKTVNSFGNFDFKKERYSFIEMK